MNNMNSLIYKANSVINEELYDKTSFPNENNNEPINKPSNEDFDQFKQQVAEWIKIDDQIRKLSIALRERRTHQKALGKKQSTICKQKRKESISSLIWINNEQHNLRVKFDELESYIQQGYTKGRGKIIFKEKSNG